MTDDCQRGASPPVELSDGTLRGWVTWSCRGDQRQPAREACTGRLLDGRVVATGSPDRASAVRVLAGRGAP